MVNCLPLQWLKNKQVMDLASLSFSPEGHCAQNPNSLEHGTLSFRPDYTDWIPLRQKWEGDLLCSSFKKWESFYTSETPPETEALVEILILGQA